MGWAGPRWAGLGWSEKAPWAMDPAGGMPACRQPWGLPASAAPLVCHPVGGCPPLYAGLLFFRHSKNTSRFIDAWQKQLDSDSKVGWASWCGRTQGTRPALLAPPLLCFGGRRTAALPGVACSLSLARHAGMRAATRVHAPALPPIAA